MDGVDEPCSSTPPTGQHQHQKRTFDVLRKPDIFRRSRHVTRRPRWAIGENTSFAGTRQAVEEFSFRDLWEDRMGRSLLLWLIGIPLPIVLLLYFFVFR